MKDYKKERRSYLLLIINSSLAAFFCGVFASKGLDDGFEFVAAIVCGLNIGLIPFLIMKYRKLKPSDQEDA